MYTTPAEPCVSVGHLFAAYPRLGLLCLTLVAAGINLPGTLFQVPANTEPTSICSGDLYDLQEYAEVWCVNPPVGDSLTSNTKYETDPVLP